MAGELTPKGIQPLQPDVISRDLQPRSDIKREIPITDARIRQILARFTPILYQGIAESDTFFARSSSQTIHSAVLMTDEEVGRWDEEFGIRERVSQDARRLFVPSMDQSDLEDLQRSAPINPLTGRTIADESAPEAAEQERYRVNLNPAIFVPLENFDPKDMQFLIRVQAHLGGQLYEKGSLYNAFIMLNTFVKDGKGKWAVKHIQRTGNASWNRPAYGPYTAQSIGLWFNTKVEPEKQNELTVRLNNGTNVMLGAEIHHPEQLDSLQIPQDREIRFFFWQLDKFVGNAALNEPQRILPPSR